MILAISYSHADIDQALRLLKWIAWLSYSNGHSMKKEGALLVCSKSARERNAQKEIQRLAPKIFGKVLLWEMETEQEIGWPGVCNFMFGKVLELATGEDMLFLEPDAVPLKPNWFAAIKDAWHKRPKRTHFMGALVDYPSVHMTGNAVYGKDALTVAPSLAELVVHTGWDVHSAPEVLPLCHFTKLIQHVWFRFLKDDKALKYEDLSLAHVAPEAVIFHQDKKGRLLPLLDQKLFGGKADAAVGYSRRPETKVMTHYFLNHNYNRPLIINGRPYQSEPFEIFASSWRGMMVTDNEEEILALQEFIRGPDNFNWIVELTKEEYEERTKKKVMPSPPSTASEASPVVVGAQITQVPALLVEGRVEETAKEEAPVNSIDDILTIGKVKLPETVISPLKKKVAAKKK